MLACSRIDNFIGAILLSGSYKILIATQTELSIYAILYQKLLKITIIKESSRDFQAVYFIFLYIIYLFKMAADLMNKFVAIICENQLLIFCVNSLNKTIETYCGTNQVDNFYL